MSNRSKEYSIDDHIVQIVVQSYDYISSNAGKEYKDAIPLSLWREEFGIVRIRSPRQLGLTSAAARLFLMYPTSVYITSNPRAMWSFQQMIDPGSIDKQRLQSNVLCKRDDYQSFLSIAHSTERFDLVIVDPATSFRKEELDFIKTSFDDKTDLFVVLG